MRITLGHTFDVRVLKMDRPDGRKVLKFDGAFGPEGCGGGFAADFKKGRGSAAGCIERLHRFAQGATAALPLRVADCPSGNAYKISVTGLALWVI